MASPLSQIIRRPAGKGWLILTGADAQEDHILRTLAVAERAGSVIALTPNVRDLPAVEIALDPWLATFGWSGKARAFGSAESASLEVLRDEIEEAALILFPDLGDSKSLLEAIGSADLQDLVLAALDDGALLVASGVAAEVLGEWLMDSNGQTIPGLGWIPGSILQTHFDPRMTCPILSRRPGLIRLGLPSCAALALGPDGERELWGMDKPTLTFGMGWGK